jgi:hypothetical protein
MSESIPVVAVVTFPAPPPRSPAETRTLLEQAGPEYTRIPGLRRKYFMMGEGEAGGVYEWDSRERADAFYNDEWYATMTESYGARPTVRIYDSPAIADGNAGRLEIYLP